MTNTDHVAQWLAVRRDAMVDFTCDLVKLATLAGDGSISTIRRYEPHGLSPLYD